MSNELGGNRGNDLRAPGRRRAIRASAERITAFRSEAARIAIEIYAAAKLRAARASRV